MHILLIEIDFQVPASQSLKEKRAVVKSLVDRLRTRYNVSVAEVAHQDKWQLAGLAVVTVSTRRDRVERTAREVLEEIETRFDVVVCGVNEQWL